MTSQRGNPFLVLHFIFVSLCYLVGYCCSVVDIRGWPDSLLFYRREQRGSHRKKDISKATHAEPRADDLPGQAGL